MRTKVVNYLQSKAIFINNELLIKYYIRSANDVNIREGRETVGNVI